MGDVEKENKLPSKRVDPVPVYRSEDLFKAKNRAEILHQGERYVLRETRTGKLILNK